MGEIEIFEAYQVLRHRIGGISATEIGGLYTRQDRACTRIPTVRRFEMTTLVYSAPDPQTGDTAALEFYLQAAAKIVETVAFGRAPQTSPAAVEKLLQLACEIKRAAENLRYDS